jgi:hypothetical protein
MSEFFVESSTLHIHITKRPITFPSNTSYNVAKRAQLNSCLNSNYNLCFVTAWMVAVVAASGRFMRCILLINQSMLTPVPLVEPSFSTKRDGEM